MKKNRFFTSPILLAVLLAGLLVVLLGCPTAAPEAKKKGGDDGGDPVVLSDLGTTDKYISFHTYLGEVKNNTGGALSGVVFVVSSEATPKALADIDDTAKVVRDFNAGETRNISVRWTDTFKRTELFTAGTITTDVDDLKITSGAGNAIDITADGDYATNKLSWLLRENTQYYLHSYYNGKTLSHAFKTKAYPTSTSEANALFDGGNTGRVFNVNNRPQIELRAPNPIVEFYSVYNNADTVSYKFGVNNQGVCYSTLGCDSFKGIFVVFKNNALLEGHTTPKPSFTILDTVLIEDTMRETGDISATTAYGGDTSPARIIKRVTR